MSWTPHVTVATIIEHNGLFLCVEEKTKDTGQLVFNQPAGHVEQNETLIEAAIREKLEETAHLVEVQHLLGIYTYTPTMQSNQFTVQIDTLMADAETETYYRFCYTAKVIQNHPEQALDKGIERTVWMSRDELVASNRARSPLVIQCIDDYLSGQRFPLNVVFEHQWQAKVDA